MNKTILAVAIAMASAGAFATGSHDSAGSGVTASVGGSVSAQSIGGGSSSVLMHSKAGAISGTASGTYADSNIAGGGVITGSAAGGAAWAHTSGVVNGEGAYGINGASAAYQANTASSGGVSEIGMDMNAGTESSVAGSAGTLVEGTGEATAFTASAAGSAAGVAGHRNVDIDGYYRKGEKEYGRKGCCVRYWTRTDEYGVETTESSKLVGGSLSAAGSVSYASTEGDGAQAGAGSVANTSAEYDGSIRTFNTSAEGNGGSAASAGSSVIVAGGESGFAAAGAIAGAAFKADATQLVDHGGEMHVHGKDTCWGNYAYYAHPTGNEYTIVVNTANASDIKGAAAGSVVHGDGASAGAGAGAGVFAEATAGDEVDTSGGEVED